MVTSPRQSARDFRIAPEAFYADLDMLLRSGDPKPVMWQIIEWTRQIAEVHNRTQAGKLNNCGTLTLDINQSSTTLNDRRIGAKSILYFAPTTANAATEVATLYQTFPNTTKGQAVINHANNAVADRTFAYTIFC